MAARNVAVAMMSRSNSATGSAAGNDTSQVDARILQWTPQEVSGWLKSKGYEKQGDAFARHGVDGSMLFQLEPADFEQIGVRKVGVRMHLEDLIAQLSSAHIRAEISDLRVPSWPNAFSQFFTYRWAGTSEGKTGAESKEELTGANLAISLVSALMTAVAFDWFLSVSSDCFCSNQDPPLGEERLCFCSTGYDLEGMPLELFFLFSGLSAVLFLCSTVLCIMQIVAINEMSDEDEMQEFFEMLEEHETLPGKMVSLGLFTLVIAQFVFSTQTVQLGSFGNGGGISYMCNFVVFVIVAYTAYANASMARGVYVAKIQVADELARAAEEKKAEAARKDRERMSQARAQQEGRGDGKRGRSESRRHMSFNRQPDEESDRTAPEMRVVM